MGKGLLFVFDKTFWMAVLRGTLSDCHGSFRLTGVWWASSCWRTGSRGMQAGAIRESEDCINM